MTDKKEKEKEQPKEQPKVLLRMADGGVLDLYPLFLAGRDWTVSIGKELKEQIYRLELRIAELEKQLNGKEVDNGGST